MEAQAITPILNVSDLQQSFDWFASLGWKKVWDWGSPPSFGGVGSGQCEIFLCVDGQGGRGKGSNTATFNQENGETADQGVWLSIWVEDLESAYQRCLDEGIEILHDPEDMPWHVREFHVRHPDGHVFRISKGLAEGE